MAYMFRQKLRLEDLANLKSAPKKVLVFEPEEYLSALYAHYLRQQAFLVSQCAQIENLLAEVAGFGPHLLVFNAEPKGNFDMGRAWLFECKKAHPELVVVTTAFNAGTQAVSELMEAGCQSHINRNFSRPQDLGLVVSTLLHNN